MLIVKRNKSVVAACLILAMALMYGAFPAITPVIAGNLTNVSDTISDSAPEASATHTIAFNLYETLYTGDFVQITFEGDGTLTTGFGDVAANNNGQAICPAGFTAAASSTGNIIDCYVSAASIASTTNLSMTTAEITNPEFAGDYDVTLKTFDVSGASPALTDETTIKVYIISSVEMTARVEATLTFTIGSVDPMATSSINGVDITGTSTANSIPFGNLDSAGVYSIAQNLSVTTNAHDGFSVTVQQDGDMRSAAGAVISPFNNGTPPVGTNTWTVPSGDINTPATWGHMGVTSDDSSDIGLDYTVSKYAGLDGATPLEVFAHDGPADGSYAGAGSANVIYSIELTDMQAAGDYSSILTYICTPVY